MVKDYTIKSAPLREWGRRFSLELHYKGYEVKDMEKYMVGPHFSFTNGGILNSELFN